MPTLSALVTQHADLDATDVEWLHLLVGDWQLLSDLSFADLVLWIPCRDGDGFVAVAHARPSTGPTVYYDDVVGQHVRPGRRPQLDRAMDKDTICSERDPAREDDVAIREETVPVHRGRTTSGRPDARSRRPVAVLSRHTNLEAARTPSRLEITYLQCADDLARMVATGDFPSAGAPTGPRRGAPRVGDGLLRLDSEGVTTYASPNALSAFHRMGVVGDLVGRSLAEATTSVVQPRSPVDETLPLVLTGRAPWRTDVEGHGTTLSLRAIPILDCGVRTGALLLLRDVSELRRRERELMTKDATIREIHHRVKNNLQTVAALLRLQARRIDSVEGRDALEEAMRRVSTIALVHETLSHGIEETLAFDEVADRVLGLAAEVADVTAAERVHTSRVGTFGVLHAQDATPLALVLTELITNAVEHGLAGRGGQVVLGAERRQVGGEEVLTVAVTDDGVGMPTDRTRPPPGDGLGSQIVRALLGGELRGTIRWSPAPTGGTVVTVEVTLRAPG